MKVRFPFLLILLAGLPCTTWAARPFVTDDARLTTAGSCQLESWTRLYRDSTEIWALPACNPTGNLEWTIGGGHFQDGQVGVPGSSDTIFQVKTLLRPLQTDRFGLGVVVGSVRHSAVNPGPNLFGNTYAYLPFSASFAQDRLITHINLGWLHDKSIGTNHTTWGVGAEFNATARWMLVAEAFGDDRNAPFWQGGVRYAIVPNLWQIDATVGARWLRNEGTSEQAYKHANWISFGLRFTPAKLF